MKPIKKWRAVRRSLEIDDQHFFQSRLRYKRPHRTKNNDISSKNSSRSHHRLTDQLSLSDLNLPDNNFRQWRKRERANRSCMCVIALLYFTQEHCVRVIAIVCKLLREDFVSCSACARLWARWDARAICFICMSFSSHVIMNAYTIVPFTEHCSNGSAQYNQMIVMVVDSLNRMLWQRI